MTDSANFTTPEAGDEDLGDLLLEILPGDGSTMGNLSAREALSRAAERQVSEEEYESVKGKKYDYILGMENAEEEGANERVHTEKSRKKHRTYTGRHLAWKTGPRALARHREMGWKGPQSQEQEVA